MEHTWLKTEARTKTWDILQISHFTVRNGTLIMVDCTSKANSQIRIYVASLPYRRSLSPLERPFLRVGEPSGKEWVSGTEEGVPPRESFGSVHGGQGREFPLCKLASTHAP